MTSPPPPDLFARRVCLQLPNMDAVTVRRDIRYASDAGNPLLMDLYEPEGESPPGGWPAVVIVTGYSGARPPQPGAPPYKSTGWAVSTAQLIARSGLAAIAYTSLDPGSDLRRLLAYIRTEAAALHVDASRHGILAVSGNVPTALAALARDAAHPPACCVFSYGCLLDLDGATDVAEAAGQFGFSNPLAGASVADLRSDVPMLIVRAGRDQFPAMNASIDRFVAHALAANLPISLINYAAGSHAFDLFDGSDAARSVLRQQLAFLRDCLPTG
ncbi:MAG: alpha/beta hydrolase [Vicinamibacterales bacterium]